MNSKVASVLKDVDEEKGYKIGDPWRWDDKALGVVVPVTLARSGRFASLLEDPRPVRKYKTNHEVDTIEVKDTGHISGLKVKNSGDSAVFFRTGSVFGGSTQERGLQRSVVVAAGEEAVVDVRCVHASKGISPGAGMRDEKIIAPISVTRNLIGGSQGTVWSSVNSFCSSGTSSDDPDSDSDISIGASFDSFSGRTRSRGIEIYGLCASHDNLCSFNSNLNNSSSGSDDLLSTLKGTDTGKMDEMLRKVPYTESQVGAFLFDHKGVLGFELFDSPDSWKAIKDAIISRFGDEISDTEADIPFTLDKNTVRKLIKKFLADLAGAAEENTKEGGGAKTSTVLFKGFIGEYTTLEDGMIHILVARSE